MVKTGEKTKWADFLLWVNILLRFPPVYTYVRGLRCRDKLLSPESDVYRRQILTTKVYLRAEMVNHVLINGTCYVVYFTW